MVPCGVMRLSDSDGLPFDRAVEASRARRAPRPGTSSPPAALMNASRSVTSFRSIKTSDNGRDKHSKGPFGHVGHGRAAPAHKATTGPSRRRTFFRCNTA